MRVLLVNPPARHHIQTEVPPAVEEENLSWPPMGLLHLATWIRKESSHSVSLLDASLERLDENEIEARIREIEPEVVGITCFTVGLVDVVKTIDAARRCPSVRHVVLGGPHVNDFPAQARGLWGVDAVVRGEGQRPLIELLTRWESGKEIRGIPGVLATPDDPVPSQDVYLSDNLDDQPIPDRTLLDPGRYRYVAGEGGLFTTVHTSRGCPYHCTFCNTPRHVYRSMSPGRVCDELQACLDLGIHEVYFSDDTFNITNKRVHDICTEILKRGLKISWIARCRVKGVDEELLRRMKAAGCVRLQFGVEQGTQEGLDRFKKGVTIPEIEQAFALCRKVGVRTVAYFILGSPVERSRRDVLRTIDYSIRLKPDFAFYNLLTPFPGTPLFEEGVAEGVLRREPWDEFLRRPYAGFRAPLWERYFTRKELQDLLQLAFRRFYWRPGFVLRNLLQIRGRDDLQRKARAGLRLLTGR